LVASPAYSSFPGTFEKINDAINLLCGYPIDQIGRFHPGDPMSYDQRFASQKIWVNHISELTTLDKKFFKSYWIPVHSNLCEWFVDMLDPSLPVFSCFFFEEEPRAWFRNIISQSLSKLIVKIDQGLNEHDLINLEHQGIMKIITSELGIRAQMRIKGLTCN